MAKFDEEEEETYEEDGVDVMGKVNYGTDGEVEMMKRVVTSFEKDAGFVRFLVTVYDFLAKGNSE